MRILTALGALGFITLSAGCSAQTPEEVMQAEFDYIESASARALDAETDRGIARLDREITRVLVLLPPDDREDFMAGYHAARQDLWAEARSERKRQLANAYTLSEMRNGYRAAPDRVTEAHDYLGRASFAHGAKIMADAIRAGCQSAGETSVEACREILVKADAALARLR